MHNNATSLIINLERESTDNEQIEKKGSTLIGIHAGVKIAVGYRPKSSHLVRLAVHSTQWSAHYANEINEYNIPYKQNIWRTLYLANEGKNRIGERLNWRSTI